MAEYGLEQAIVGMEMQEQVFARCAARTERPQALWFILVLASARFWCKVIIRYGFRALGTKELPPSELQLHCTHQANKFLGLYMYIFYG